MTDITKCHYRTANGRLVFEISGGSMKDIFEGIAAVQEVFEADTSCGCCGSQDISFRVRESSKGNKTFKYYELRCNQPHCRARFSFGQNQDMKNLFPKRTDENGDWLPNRGWYKYQPQMQEDVA
jgi:hypothetical protein